MSERLKIKRSVTGPEPKLVQIPPDPPQPGFPQISACGQPLANVGTMTHPGGTCDVLWPQLLRLNSDG